MGALGLFAASPAQAQSSDNTLSALGVEVSTDGVNFAAAGIWPEFSSGQRSYDTAVSASHTHARVTPTANHSGATLQVGQGSSLTPLASGSTSAAVALVDGANEIRIRVTAEDLSHRSYYVTVTRGGRLVPAPPRNVQAIAGSGKLTLTWTAPAHWGSFPTRGYEVDWYAGASPPADETDWNLATTFYSPLAATTTSYEFTGTYGDHTVANGTTYQLRIRAWSTNPDDSADHLPSEWVTKAGTPTAQSLSSNANLSGLTASSSTSATGLYAALTLTPSTFSPSTTSYTATVATARTHAKLTPTVADAGKATVTVNGTPVNSGSASTAIALSEGANAITVRVTAQDSTTKDYTVTITRQMQGATPEVSLSADPNPVAEGSPVTVTATLTSALSAGVTIPLTLADDSAEPADHGTLAGITIAPNATTGTGTIATHQDDDEDDERFTVALDTANLPSSVTAGARSSVQVRIRDDDDSGDDDDDGGDDDSGGDDDDGGDDGSGGGEEDGESSNCTLVAPYWSGPTGGFTVRPVPGRTSVSVTCGGRTTEYMAEDGLVTRLLRSRCPGGLRLEGAAPGGWYWQHGERNAAAAPFVCSEALGGPRAVVPGGVEAKATDDGTWFRHDTARLIGIVPHLAGNECGAYVTPYWQGDGGVVVRPAAGRTSVKVRVQCGATWSTMTPSSGDDGVIAELVRKDYCTDDEGEPKQGRLTVTGAAPGGWYWIDGERNAAAAPLMCADLLGGPAAVNPGGVTSRATEDGTYFSHDANKLIGVVPHVATDREDN